MTELFSAYSDTLDQKTASMFCLFGKIHMVLMWRTVVFFDNIHFKRYSGTQLHLLQNLQLIQLLYARNSLGLGTAFPMLITVSSVEEGFYFKPFPYVFTY